jgi:hypothetical protein
MNRFLWLSILGLGGLAAMAADAQAQRSAYIAYVYPAGGQQGTSFPIRLGGQRLTGLNDVIVSGRGVTARLVEYHRRMSNQELTLIREQLRQLKRKEAQKAKAKEEVDQATRKMIARIEERMAEWVNRPACASHAELAFVEITIAPDAEPGAREVRLVTQTGVTNPLVFHVGQVPEVARKPMTTALLQVLGKEHLAQRKRPEEEVEERITVPCTMNGQIASGEVNRYRFEARQGQRLVVSTAARQLIPYIADAVPGWFQPVITVFDADGKEVAFNDDYRFKPDPTFLFEVPKDGEYVLEITDAIYRGREDFVYRVTIGELPFVTSIFPLGGRAGEPVTIEMNGWNLDKAKLRPPPTTAQPGVCPVVANRGRLVSNSVPFAFDTLPECFDREPNNDPSEAQKVELPVIVNGRMDQPDDWDVFRIEGRAGDTIVAEVTARRLDSPMDSLLKLTDESGTLVAFNDDHEDLGSGLNTHHADSYLMVELPADGTYYVHLGDTARCGGQAYAYRLRISPPRPDFALRAVPSRLAFRSKAGAVVTIYAFRKDGFTGDIKLSLKDPPEGFSSSTVTLPANSDTVRFAARTQLTDTPQPVNLTIEGRAQAEDQEIVNEAVPAEDWMQAFLWRHLVPAEDLKAFVYDPSYQPPATRVPPELKPEDKVAEPAAGPPKFSKRQVQGRLRQLKMLYEEWLLTDDFYLQKVAECEAAL